MAAPTPSNTSARCRRLILAVLLLSTPSAVEGFHHQRHHGSRRGLPASVQAGPCLGSNHHRRPHPLRRSPAELLPGHHRIRRGPFGVPERPLACRSGGTALGMVGVPASLAAAATALSSPAVQKILELASIAGIGYALRSRLDPKGITGLLLNALVPSIIVSSLSGLSVSAESLGRVVASGVALAVAQLVGSELASRFVIPPKRGGDEFEADILRRTAAVQLSSMAPGLSVLSFTKEFAGLTLAGLSTLADVPSKVYTLVLLPYYLRFRGIVADREVEEGETEAEASLATERSSFLQTIKTSASDPFNLSISCGLILAALGRPVHTLGFVGNAIGSLAKSQTAVLFLLIGLKLKFSGDRPKLCLRLLLARHGFMSLFASVYLATCMPLSRGVSDATRLAAVLSSHAASSIIAYGQMSKAVSSEENRQNEADRVQGYDVDLAFDIVALSYQMTMVLNTLACLAGRSYVNNLPVVGATMLGLSAAIGKIGGTK